MKPNILCLYKDDLPYDAGGMLWGEGSLLEREHINMRQADSLLAPVVADIFAEPSYVVQYARSALASTVVQLFQWDVGSGLHAYMDGTSPYQNLLGRIPVEWYSYATGRQQWNYWVDLDAMNRRIGAVLIISLLVLALFWLDRHDGAHPILVSLLLWVIVWSISNAAVTSAISVVDARLQSRIMWLYTMVAVLAILHKPDIFRFIRSR